MCLIHDIDVHNVICTHLDASAHYVVHWGMHQNGIQHHAPPDDPDIFISLFYYAVWPDFIRVNFTCINYFLSMDSENDLCF